MAGAIIRYYYGVSPEAGFKKSMPKKRPLLKSIVAMSSNAPIQVIRLPTKKSKVFEDKSQGIVCYREDNGEITCEGFDEGPRFHHNFSRTAAASDTTRDAEIVDLLQRSWPQIFGNKKIP